MSRVLIVDDEANLLELYRVELQQEGYEVLTALTGKQAMEALKGNLPDAVVMDIRMPEMDGIEALGKMVGRHKDIPVIIHTAYQSHRDDFRAWAADAYIVKSSDLTCLKETLHDMLTQAHFK